MEWVHRFLKSGLGGNPRDSVRALEVLRGSRMAPKEAEAWLSILEGTSREAGASC
jgi:hypothetical protein